MRISELPEIGKLSIPEKILLLEDMWENIASYETSVPVPQSHINEVHLRAFLHLGQALLQA